MGMTATDELRRMLDERGVEHTDAEDGHTQHTWWSDGDHEIGASNSGKRLAVYNLTPEQAIAATLGRGTCRNVAESDEYSDRPFTCSECGARGPMGNGTYHIASSWAMEDGTHVFADSWPVWKYCPNCGRKVVGE